MNHEWLSSFVTFADKLNFTHAAKERHISQPALHVQIKKLSEEVGVPLYRREGRGLTLTAEGKKLAAFGRAMKEQSNDVLRELRGESASGPVVLASGQGAFLYLLGRAIRRFPKAKWPLRLLTMRGPDAVDAVRDGEAHLAVAVLDRKLDDLPCTQLRSVGQIAVMPKSHRLARRRRLEPGDLHEEKLVVPPEGSPHRMMLEQAIRTDGGTLTVGVEAGGWELMLEFAKNGMGIAVVNDFCGAPRGCVAVEVQRLPKATYCLVERARSTKGMDRLRSLIVNTVSTLTSRDQRTWPAFGGGGSGLSGSNAGDRAPDR